MVVATLTNYDPITKRLLTSTSVVSVIEEVTRRLPKAIIVVKSTVPVEPLRMRAVFGQRRHSFSRRSFWHEAAPHDIYPSRTSSAPPTALACSRPCSSAVPRRRTSPSS